MAPRRLTNDDWGLDSSCFVCESRNKSGMQLELWADDETGQVWTDLHLGAEFSGAPTLVHGGISLAVLDEVQAERFSGAEVSDENRRFLTDD